MAEVVQKMMERMLPELELLLKNGIFSEVEINAIVKQRRRFEYALRSQNVNLDDYLRYIDYEINLEKLRELRVKKLQFPPKKRSILAKQSGKKRIHNVYRRALFKYSNNIELWLQYIKLCQSLRSNKSLGFAFAQALKLHPLSVDIWLKAAFWEYEQNHNVNAARVLLQKALRILKHEKKLWHHYLRLELLYRKKLTDRLRIMGVDQIALGSEPAKENSINLDENSDTKSAESDKVLDDMDKETGKIADGSTGSSNPFFEGKIASIIFQNACKTFPEDFDFVLDFWKIYRQFNDTEHLQKEVYEYIKSFSEINSAARGFLSRVPLLSCNSIEYSSDFLNLFEECKKNFDENIKEYETSDMYLEYTSFFDQLLSRCVDDKCLKLFTKEKLKVLEQATSNDCMNEELYTQWVNTLIDEERYSDALKIGNQAISQFKYSIEMKELCYEAIILSNCENSSKNWKDDLSELLAKTLDQLEEDLDELWPVWVLLKNYFIITKAPVEQITKYLKKLFVKNPKDVHDIKNDVIMFTSIQYDLNTVREVFKTTREFPPTKIETYDKVIQIELSQVSQNIKTIRTLFEQAVIEKEAKDHPDLFLKYIQFELRNHNFEKIQAIHWKATKTLNDRDSFEKQYQKIAK